MEGICVAKAQELNCRKNVWYLSEQTFISILRGIKVSGQKKILMTDLKALYGSLHFKEVATYIQSGNVVFKSDSKLSDTQLAQKLKRN